MDLVLALHSTIIVTFFALSLSCRNNFRWLIAAISEDNIVCPNISDDSKGPTTRFYRTTASVKKNFNYYTTRNLAVIDIRWEFRSFKGVIKCISFIDISFLFRFFVLISVVKRGRFHQYQGCMQLLGLPTATQYSTIVPLSNDRIWNEAASWPLPGLKTWYLPLGCM